MRCRPQSYDFMHFEFDIRQAKQHGPRRREPPCVASHTANHRIAHLSTKTRTDTNITRLIRTLIPIHWCNDHTKCVMVVMLSIIYPTRPIDPSTTELPIPELPATDPSLAELPNGKLANTDLSQ